LATLPLLPLTEDVLWKTNQLFESELSKQFNTLNSEEEFWVWVQESFSKSPDVINLNNGGVSPQPLVVQEAFKRYYDICNQAPSYYMWRKYKSDVGEIKAQLADMLGVSEEELILNRNTTEGLDTIINGLPLEKGDEVIVSPFDYPHMKNAWKMREKYDGIVLKWVTFPAPCDNEQTLIDTYASAFSAKTKVVHLTHVVNWTGQILPVSEIAKAAQSKDIEVLIDGAHSFAQLEFKVPELHADYFGTSLHKWLCAPFGTGVTYIKQDKIEKIKPIFPGEEDTKNSIVKFENIGTHSVPSKLAIGHAISFHNKVGSAKKRNRLYELKQYWIDQIKDLPGVTIFTPHSKNMSGAIATVGLKNKTGGDLSTYFQKNYKLHTTSVEIENVNGMRVTPNIYTKKSDLDLLVAGFKELTKG
jgi:selenocysteine lyase/cysteine desulfurase